MVATLHSSPVIRIGPPVRFSSLTGGSSDPKSPADIFAQADTFRSTLKQAEGMPDAKPGVSAMEQLAAHLIGGDGTLGRTFVDALTRVLSQQPKERSIETEVFNDGIRQKLGYRVKSGTVDRLFQHRTLQSAHDLPFSAFLEKKFGKNDRVILSVTGWTKPPVEFLRQNDFYRSEMDKLPREDWPAYAELVYVDVTKQYLNGLVDTLQREVPGFNPVRDLGFIYGVTPSGVDRAIQDYCREKSIPLAGLTCYDWAEYIPDHPGLPDVYIANNPSEFGQLMANHSSRVIVTGGRAIAANMRMDGEQADAAQRRIPADVMKSFANVTIPPIAEDNEQFGTRVLNAAQLAQLMPNGNPWDWDIVKQAINGRTTDNEAVFVSSQVIKQDLRNLYQIRRLKQQTGSI